MGSTVHRNADLPVAPGPGDDRAHAAPGHPHELDVGRLRALHDQEATRRRRPSCVLQRGVTVGPGLPPPHRPSSAPGERRLRAGNAALPHRTPASGAAGAPVVQAGSPATTPTGRWTPLVGRTATATMTRECRARRPCATAPAPSAMRSRGACPPFSMLSDSSKTQEGCGEQAQMDYPGTHGSVG